MKSEASWELFETQASGMKRSFYVLEIAAQRMRDDEPQGRRSLPRSAEPPSRPGEAT
jgi:hypothetical protein